MHGGIISSNSSALVALNIGYFISLVVPFRLGELFRSGVLSYLKKADFIFILASVVFERAIDFLLIGILIPIVLGSSSKTVPLGVGFIAVSIFLFLFSFLIRSSKFFRGVVWRISNIFNIQIKMSLLHFSLSLEELFFKAKILNKLNFWLLTLLMWLFYLLSLYVLALSVGDSYEKIFKGIYLLPIDQSILHVLNLNLQGFGVILFYLIAPLLFTILFLVIFDSKRALNFRASLTWITSPQKYIAGPSRDGAPKFKSQENYHAFLDRKFLSSKELTKQFEDEGLGGVVVHRIFHGGSGAVTALIESSDRLIVRKYAAGQYEAALADQYKWLNSYANSLPLVKVHELVQLRNGMYYEMDFNGSTKEFYEIIHTSDIDTSQTLLFDLLEKIRIFHASNLLSECDDETLNEYLASKVCFNLSEIKKIIPEIFEMKTLVVNDRQFDMRLFSIFDNCSWLANLLTIRRQSTVHGDLTIENILINSNPGNKFDWFLIDPNPNNLFSSPFIDYAKLFQSLHLGYEALNKNCQSYLIGNKLSIHIHRSSQYKKLYESLVRHIALTYGQLALREIYLHELILFMRLIPYQARKDVRRAYVFFGVLCLLLLEFRDNYPECFDD